MAEHYEEEAGCEAAVLFDPRAADWIGDGLPRQLEVDALTALRWLSRPVAQAPRLLVLERDGHKALLVHLGVDVVTGEILLGVAQKAGRALAAVLGELGVDAVEADPDDGGSERVLAPQDGLARVLFAALTPAEEAPTSLAESRPPVPARESLPLDIYAPAYIGLATDFGAPLDSIWHQFWELNGPRWCLLNTDLEDPDLVASIPYRQSLAPEDFVEALRICGDAGLRYLQLPLYVSTGPDSGHAIHIERFEGDLLVFHDPWPGRSLLASGNNDYGLSAQPVAGEEGRWRIGAEHLHRIGHASLVEPSVWLSHCDIAVDVEYAGLRDSDFFRFFHITELERGEPDRDGVAELALRPGNWHEQIDLRLWLDAEERVRTALLAVDRDWLSSAETGPFGFDLLKSFVSALVTSADRGEADLLVRALAAAPFGGLPAALAAGPPHLLEQFRSVALAAIGESAFGRATFPCSTIRALNGSRGEDPGGKKLFVSIARPEHELGPLFEDQQTGYMMDGYRSFLWRRNVDEMRRLGILGAAAPEASEGAG